MSAPLIAAAFFALVLAAPSASFAQGWRCTTIVQSSDDDRTPPKRVERCAREGRDIVERNPLADETAPATPPVKRVKVPDPKREARVFREQLHQALRKQQRGVPGTSPECDAVLSQIGEQQSLIRSLRADTRTQGRKQLDLLMKTFVERGC